MVGTTWSAMEWSIGLKPSRALSPADLRKLDDGFKVSDEDHKDLCIVFQTNGFTRTVRSSADPAHTSCDTPQRSQSSALDLKILKKANGCRLVKPQCDPGSRLVSMNRKRPPEHGLEPVELVKNGVCHTPIRSLVRFDSLSLALIDQPTQSEDVSPPKSVAISNPPFQRPILDNFAKSPPSDEVPSDDLTVTEVTDPEGVPSPQMGAQRYDSIGDACDISFRTFRNYRSAQKQKFCSVNPNPLEFFGSTCTDRVQIVTTDDETGATPDLNCRLPSNGHREDTHHYCHCEFVTGGILLREEHDKWLRDLPCESEMERIINFIIGSSCKQFILSSKCSKEHCTSKHNVGLSFQVPRERNLFSKWFLKNAVVPDFRLILFLLYHLPKDHGDTFMLVLSCARVMIKLTSRVYRQALGVKLIEIMVRVLEYKPWEAVRALFIFAVTPEMQLSDILTFLNCFDLMKAASETQLLKNHLYESVACLWHINKSFVCQADLLFVILKECLEKMPEDLKLTKDRVLIDFLKLPRSLLRREFLSIDKFLDKYYPKNSIVAQAFRANVFHGVAIAKSLSERGTYETSRVKGTGPVNHQWHYWSIQEARVKGFNSVVNKSRKAKPPTKVTIRSGPMTGLGKNYVHVGNDDQHESVEGANLSSNFGNRVPSCDLRVEETYDSQCLIGPFHSGKYGQVVNMMIKCAKTNKDSSFDSCLLTLRRELESCDKARINLVVFEIFKSMSASPSDTSAVKSGFVRMINSLVVDLYRKANYTSAVKLMKVMRVVGVNHLDHVPNGTNAQTFAVICSDSHFRCRLFPDAIRTLMYKNCFEFVNRDGSFTDHFYLLEKLVMNMFRCFLKEQLACYALLIFRLTFAAQKNLHYPFNIGKYYEGVIFLSFVSDLKKNACADGEGANMYAAVERISGNSVTFHSITYRSLLVELDRAGFPEVIILRTLRICLARKIYPDFTRGPIFPLVLNSHLTIEEIEIFLKHYFTYFVVQNDVHRLTNRPFVVRFHETPLPDKKLFPVSNYVMKTSRSVQDALERLKSVLSGFSNKLDLTQDASFSQDNVILSVQGVATLLDVFKR